ASGITARRGEAGSAHLVEVGRELHLGAEQIAARGGPRQLGARALLDPDHEVAVGGGLHDPTELGPIVRDQADPIDRDVAHQPAIALVDHPVVEADRAAAAAHDDGAY